MRATLAALLLASGGSLWAGDLAAAAEREAERRKSAKARATRLLNDADLASLPDRPSRPTDESPPAETPGPVQAPSRTSSGGKATPRRVPSPGYDPYNPSHWSPEGTEQGYWSLRAKVAHQQVASAERLIADLRSGSEHVEEVRSCGRRNGRNWPPMLTLADALGLASDELSAARLALDALEDEARRARVPPGWVRER